MQSRASEPARMSRPVWSLGHLSAGRLVCPHHAASFNLEDGSISQGWASRPLRIYPVRVEQGQVWIKVAGD